MKSILYMFRNRRKRIEHIEFLKGAIEDGSDLETIDASKIKPGTIEADKIEVIRMGE